VGGKSGDGRITMQSDAGVLQSSGHRRQKSLGDVTMHEQRLRGVAHRRSAGLGVEHYRLGHGQVSRGVDVDMTVADAGLDHRHGVA